LSRQGSNGFWEIGRREIGQCYVLEHGSQICPHRDPNLRQHGCRSAKLQRVGSNPLDGRQWPLDGTDDLSEVDRFGRSGE
jgi:hypothetical protein